MDVYFHSSTSSSAAIANDKDKKFWQMAKFMSKHDRRIAPSSNEVTSLKKRAMQYFSAVKPAQKQSLSSSQEQNTTLQPIKPSLSGQTNSSSASSYRLRKAMAWLGRSFHRFQCSGLLKFKKMGNNQSLSSLGDYDDHSTGRHAFEDSERPFAYSDSKKEDLELHIRVLRVTNLASAKERDYELDIRVNDVSQTLIRGNLIKVTKKISSSKSYPNSVVVQLKEDEQVSLEFVVATQAPKQLMHGLTKAMMNASDKNVAPLQVVGLARVPHNGAVGRRETRRYKLANPNQIKGWDLDLTVELSYTQPQKQQKQQPPWTYYTHTSGLSNLTVDDEDEECDHETLKDAQAHCVNGDYLTFYVRGRSFPTWERYWVTLQEDRLWMRNFSYKEQRDPVDSIPLQHLSRVTKPSLDDQDHVCLGRSHGLVLQMNPESISNQQIQEPFEGKIFLFADNASNALQWRRALAAYMANIKPSVVKGGANPKYIW
ncbi:hypothetical protein BJV82DRAFT_608045 [Fennellomyces sp. T-0311]|nr:hypothetical protein BJV82DRAFT_608045 [Fennellomyces sp. T-0311]